MEKEWRWNRTVQWLHKKKKKLTEEWGLIDKGEVGIKYEDTAMEGRVDKKSYG